LDLITLEIRSHPDAAEEEMAKTVKDLLAEANMSVQKLSPAEAAEKNPVR